MIEAPAPASPAHQEPARAPDPQEPAHTHPFPPSLAQQAAANPGGWVYDVDPGVPETGPIPLQGIIGAWRVGEDGVPTGEFVPNTQHRPGLAVAPRSRRRRGIVLFVVVVLAIVVVAAVLVFLLTRDTSDKSPHATVRSSRVVTVPATTTASTPARRTTPPAGPARARPSTAGGPPATVHLQLVAKQRVWVCVQNHASRLLIDGQILPAGTVSDRFASSSFRVSLGNGGVDFRINGHLHSIAASSNPVAYAVSNGGVTRLPDRSVPPCA